MELPDRCNTSRSRDRKRCARLRLLKSNELAVRVDLRRDESRNEQTFLFQIRNLDYLTRAADALAVRVTKRNAEIIYAGFLYFYVGRVQETVPLDRRNSGSRNFESV